MKLINLINFDIHGDHRGSLISLEQHKNIPFEIKRAYYLFGTEADIARGFHAHKELHQVAICLSGSCTFIMDDGKKRDSVMLDRPDTGIYIAPSQWHEMHNFSPDCVMLVLANDYYAESDYIRNYDDFKEFVKC